MKKKTEAEITEERIDENINVKVFLEMIPSDKRETVITLIKEGRIGVYGDEDITFVLTDVKERDNDYALRWYNIVFAISHEFKEVILYNLFHTDDVIGVKNYISNYIRYCYTDIFNFCKRSDSNTPFLLTDNKICFKKTNEVLIDISTKKAKEICDNFINEVLDEKNLKKIDGEELTVRKENTAAADFEFYNKDEIEEIAKNFVNEPISLFRIMHERGLIYVTNGDKNRYSRRARDKKIKRKMGTEELFGIKKDVLNRYKGADKIENSK